MDDAWHEDPFNMALGIHYEMVEGGEWRSPAFLEWRKTYSAIWEKRREPRLTPLQRSILRSRGVDV